MILVIWFGACDSHLEVEYVKIKVFSIDYSELFLFWVFWRIVSIGSVNGLAPVWWEAITKSIS